MVINASRLRTFIADTIMIADITGFISDIKGCGNLSLSEIRLIADIPDHTLIMYNYALKCIFMHFNSTACGERRWSVVQCLLPYKKDIILLRGVFSW